MHTLLVIKKKDLYPPPQYSKCQVDLGTSGDGEFNEWNQVHTYVVTVNLLCQLVHSWFLISKSPTSVMISSRNR